MNFALTDEHKSIQQMARDFAQKELRPRARHFDEAGEFIWEVIPQLASAGLLGFSIPEKYGGQGLDMLSAALIMEEIAKECGSTALTLASHNGLGTKHILFFGSEAQR